MRATYRGISVGAPTIQKTLTRTIGQATKGATRRTHEPDCELSDYSFADAVADEEEGVNPLAIAVVAAALVIGVGLGAGATALWMSSHHARRPPAVAAAHAPPAAKPAPLAPNQLAIAPSAPPVEAAAPAPEAKAATPRAHRASARPIGAATGSASCRGLRGARGSQREVMICEWPQIAAADREMRRAPTSMRWTPALERGSLQASQDRWLTDTEFAAQRSAAALTDAYQGRIGSNSNALAAKQAAAHGGPTFSPPLN